MARAACWRSCAEAAASRTYSAARTPSRWRSPIRSSWSQDRRCTRSASAEHPLECQCDQARQEGQAEGDCARFAEAECGAEVDESEREWRAVQHEQVGDVGDE